MPELNIIKLVKKNLPDAIPVNLGLTDCLVIDYLAIDYLAIGGKWRR